MSTDPTDTNPTEVQIHVATGCGICGSKTSHTHPYEEWRAALDAAAKETR